MKEYILLQPNEDGEPVTWLDRSEVEELLQEPDDYGVESFITESDEDPMYWSEGQAMLLKVEVLKPKTATTAWKLD